MERPKRHVNTRCLEYNNGMLPEEEIALRRALRASLQKNHKHCDKESFESDEDTRSDVELRKDTKRSLLNNRDDMRHLKKQKKFIPQISNRGSKKTGSLASRFQRGKTNKTRQLLVEKKVIKKKKRKAVSKTEVKSDSVPDESVSPSITRYAQRKFAQTSQNSPRSSFLYQNQKQLPKTRAKTEDFLDFLCLRGTERLPKPLEMFNNPCAPVSPLTDDDEQTNKSSGTSSPISKTAEPPAKRGLIMPNHTNNEQQSSNSSGSSPSSFVCPPLSTRVQPYAMLPHFTNAQTNYGVLTHMPIPYPLTGTPQHPPRPQGLDIYGLPYNNPLLASCHPCVSSVHMGIHRAPHCVTASDKQGFHLVNTHMQDTYQMPQYNISTNTNPRNSATKCFETNNNNDSTSRRGDTDGKMDFATLPNVPTFSPSEQEFKNPYRYIEGIRTEAEEYGMCIIQPPESWKPEFCLDEDVKLTTKLQHIHRLTNSMSAVEVELAAIRAHLVQQNISLNVMPQIAGCELDLIQLSKVVKEFGGLQQVINKRKWNRVADCLKIPKSAIERIGKLEQIYCKYLLSYDLLDDNEKKELFERVEKNIDTGSSNKARKESGLSMGCSAMALSAYQHNAMNHEKHHLKPNTTIQALEKTYWQIVDECKQYVVVHNGELSGTAFPPDKQTEESGPISKWYLNILPKITGSVGRDLIDVEGISHPVINVGMMFSTCPWTTPPNALYTLDYLHQGKEKLWYSVCSSGEKKFSKVVSRNIADSSDGMLSPMFLHNAGMKVYRSIQKAGQFILKFSKSFHMSVSCGYTLCESLSFTSWLQLKQLKESFDPSLREYGHKHAFSWEHLIISSIKEELKRNNAEILMVLVPELEEIRSLEAHSRSKCHQLNIVEKLKANDVETINQFTQSCAINCHICGKFLYISMVVNESGKFYCLPHAIEISQQGVDQHIGLILKTQFNMSDLDQLVNNVKDKILT